MTGRYEFLPWVREGAAGAYSNRDGLGPVLTRPDGAPLTELPVEVEVDDAGTATVTARLHGPGDVAGLDPRQVIRMDPPPRTADLEPNFLASVEFDSPDLPWLLTPAAAGSQDRLRPWLVLVVVRASGSAGLRPAAGPGLPVLTTPVDELPDLGESWAWAHAQVVRSGDGGATVAEILADHPERNLSRLLCPRRLEPLTSYLACLVPAFDAGRRAGLGQPGEDADDERLAPAWTADQERVELPVYHSWRFSTGTGGDFESLARLLKGARLPADVGGVDVIATDLPFGLPDVGLFRLDGPLVTPDTPAPPGPDPAFAGALRDLLDLGRDADRPVVTPPVYGSWQALQDRVPAPDGEPRWLRQVNLDPALRAAAGLGARVVRDHQEQLVASAWEQIGDGERAAGLERRADLAVAVLESVLRRRVARMDAGRAVQLVGPALERIPAADRTLGASLATQGLPASFSSASLRRALRPANTPLRRVAPVRISLQRVATRVGTPVPAAGPMPGGEGFVTDANLSSVLTQVELLSPFNNTADRHGEALAPLREYHRRFTPVVLLAARPTARLDAELKAGVVAGLNPAVAVRRRLLSRLSVVTPPAQPAPAAAPAPAPPSFPQPLSATLSPALLLPGVGAVEADTVTLLATNPRFVEAFLLGANHELAGELLWREVPGDVRHTYFRTFWGRAAHGQVPPIDRWDPAAALGGNHLAGPQQLVLLIRGALLHRHPDCVVSAVRARSARELGTEERLPAFRGRIDPDITFLGFDLTADQASGGPNDPGWFFVAAEQPSAPRFGLDETGPAVLASWNDLGWDRMRTTPGAHLALEDLQVPAAARPPGPQWAHNAAHMAAILRQRPVRVAWHAARLLPPGPG